jgi:formylglycine-generating enzyme required for sulfatase activity
MKEFPAFPIEVCSFRIARYPVTNRDYAEFVRATAEREPPSLAGGVSRSEHPVWGVTYSEAESYANWLSAESGTPFRLPTEIEWEYAARGPSRREYPWGDDFSVKACNTLEAGIGDTTEVTRYEDFSSPFGICDLAGNVEEWTATLYAPYPGGRWIDDDLARIHGGPYRVMRGGSCARNGDLARGARRHGPFEGEPFKYKGFRLAVDARLHS